VDAIVFGSKATASFASSQSGKQEALTMKGSWTDYSADITDEAQGGEYCLDIHAI
jgi:hypothetical protein